MWQRGVKLPLRESQGKGIQSKPPDEKMNKYKEKIKEKRKELLIYYNINKEELNHKILETLIDNYNKSFKDEKIMRDEGKSRLLIFSQKNYELIVKKLNKIINDKDIKDILIKISKKELNKNSNENTRRISLNYKLDISELNEPNEWYFQNEFSKIDLQKMLEIEKKIVIPADSFINIENKNNYIEKLSSKINFHKPSYENYNIFKESINTSNNKNTKNIKKNLNDKDYNIFNASIDKNKKNTNENKLIQMKLIDPEMEKWIEILKGDVSNGAITKNKYIKDIINRRIEILNESTNFEEFLVELQKEFIIIFFDYIKFISNIINIYISNNKNNAEEFSKTLKTTYNENDIVSLNGHVMYYIEIYYYTKLLFHISFVYSFLDIQSAEKKNLPNNIVGDGKYLNEGYHGVVYNCPNNNGCVIKKTHITKNLKNIFEFLKLDLINLLFESSNLKPNIPKVEKFIFAKNNSYSFITKVPGITLLKLLTSATYIKKSDNEKFKIIQTIFIKLCEQLKILQKNIRFMHNDLNIGNLIIDFNDNVTFDKVKEIYLIDFEKSIFQLNDQPLYVFNNYREFTILYQYIFGNKFGTFWKSCDIFYI